MLADVPPGWPPEVQPSGSEDFTASAVAWLLGVIPPGYRDSDIFAGFPAAPAALAALARQHTQARVTGARQGYRTVRSDLGGQVPPHAIDDALAAYRIEGKRFAATAHVPSTSSNAPRGLPRPLTGPARRIPA